MIYKIGDGIISPIALSSKGNFEAILRKESKLRYYENLFGLPEPCFVSLFEKDSVEEAFSHIATDGFAYTKVEKIAILAAHQAIAQAGIDASREDVLFVFSTTKGNVELLKENPYEPARPYLWRSAQLIAHFFHNPNTPLVASNACISGCAAQLAAFSQLKFNGFRYAVVVGAEVLSQFIISGFQSFKALSAERCKPFDCNRCGLNLGEAAAAMVFANSDTGDIQHTDTAPLRFLGGGINNDANHISGPSRTGEGLLRAINACFRNLDEATANQLKCHDLAFINAHGTATPYNDDMESVATYRAGLQQVPINSLKGYFGHTLGAAGILETILSSYALQYRTVLGSYGTENPGTAQEVNVCMEHQPTEGNSFIKLISGFGGSNAAILFTNLM